MSFPGQCQSAGFDPAASCFVMACFMSGWWVCCCCCCVASDFSLCEATHSPKRVDPIGTIAMTGLCRSGFVCWLSAVSRRLNSPLTRLLRKKVDPPPQEECFGVSLVRYGFVSSWLLRKSGHPLKSLCCSWFCRSLIDDAWSGSRLVALKTPLAGQGQSFCKTSDPPLSVVC